MTIGIGGWGSRRKPMTLLKALLRTDVDDLTVVSYGGPDVGILCAAGRVRKVVFAFVSLDSIPLEPHFRAARESGAIEVEEYDEGMFLLGLQAAAWNVPFLPTRVGLGSDLFRVNHRLKTVRSPYPSVRRRVRGAGGHARPASGRLAAAPEPGRRAGQRPVPRPGPLHGRPVRLGRGEDVPLLREGRAHRRADALPHAAHQPPAGRRRRRGPGGAGFTSCQPDYERDEERQKAYAVTSRDPDAWTAWLDEWTRS